MSLASRYALLSIGLTIFGFFDLSFANDDSGKAATGLGKKESQYLVLDEDYAKLKGCFVSSAASAGHTERKEAFLNEAEVNAAEKEGKQAVAAIQAYDSTGQFSTEASYGNLLKMKVGECVEGAINRKVEEISLIYDMFSKRTRSKDDDIERAKIFEHSWRDARLFMGDYNSTLKSVHRILFGPDFMRTFSGQARAAYELANPVCSVDEIVKKQQRVKLFLENKEKREEVDAILKEIAELESSWLSVWFRKHRDVSKMFVPGAMSADEMNSQLEIFHSSDWIGDEVPGIRNFFFALNKMANNSDLAMLLFKVLFKPAALSAFFANIGLTSFCYAADPGLGKNVAKHVWGVNFFCLDKTLGQFCSKSLKEDLRKNFFGDKNTGAAEFYADWFKKLMELEGEKIGGIEAGKAFRVFALGISAVTAVAIWKLCGFAEHMTKMKGVLNSQDTLCKMNRLKELMERLCLVVGKENLPKIKDLELFLDGEDSPEFGNLLKSISSGTFSGQPSWFSHHGKTIRTFVTFEKLKERLSRGMEVVGQIDFTVATAKVFEKMKGGQNQFCFPEIVHSDKPVLKAKGMWDVFLDPKVAVPNDLDLGVGNGCGNLGALVSGPNFGGKSVFLRGMLTSVLLAQSLGICPASQMTLSPFTNFDTYVTVQDDPAAQQSLFSAEMTRVKSLLNVLENAQGKDKKVFIVADELLTGTKTKYAEALVRATLKRLSEYDHGAFVFATHFDGVIGNVASDTAGAFINYKVTAELDKDGLYKRPLFKVEQGKSDIDSALFVAEKRLGREHADIIKDAKQILLGSKTSLGKA